MRKHSINAGKLQEKVGKRAGGQFFVEDIKALTMAVTRGR
jgi:hypothetical protein